MEKRAQRAVEGTQAPARQSRQAVPEESQDDGSIAGRLTSLQRTVGNQAVTTLVVQRHGTPELEEDMPAQLLREVNVQRAGETGLADAGQITKYVGSIKKAAEDWAKQTEPERAAAFGKIANERLKSIGVRPCSINTKDLGTSTMGEFDFQTWSLDLNKSLFAKATISEAEVKDVATTVYHEARHAEQWFRIARLLAGEGKKAKDIAKQMWLSPDAAKDAASQPLRKSTPIMRRFMTKDAIAHEEKKLAEAKAWFDNIYGAGAKSRNAVLTGLDTKAAAATAARQALDAKTKQRVDKKKAYDPLLADYKTFLAEYQADEAKYVAKVKAGKATTADFQAIVAKQLEKDAKYTLITQKFQELATVISEEAALTADLATKTADRDSNYQKYRNLAEEADAWALEARIGAAF